MEATFAERLDQASLEQPKLQPCLWCAGRGYEPTGSGDVLTCSRCEGGCWQEVQGDLGPTATYPRRPYLYNPGKRWLGVKRGRKVELYKLSEFQPDTTTGDAPARAFGCVKVMDGSVYHLFCDPSGVTCDCAGRTYAASDKANQRAAYRGDRTHATTGCVHGDALRVLLAAGLLDVPA